MNNGGWEEVGGYSKGASGTVLNAGGRQTVFSRGVAYGTIVNSGGQVSVQYGTIVNPVIAGGTWRWRLASSAGPSISSPVPAARCGFPVPACRVP